MSSVLKNGCALFAAPWMGRDRALARINQELPENRTVNRTPKSPYAYSFSARSRHSTDDSPVPQSHSQGVPFSSSHLDSPSTGNQPCCTDLCAKDAQAPEKKKIMGTNKWGPTISKTVMPLAPGDDPKHELVVLEISRATTTSPDPDFDGTELIAYEQADSVAGTGTQRGYFRRLHKNGDTDYGTFEGTHKTTVKEDGSWETTWEGTWKSSGGTGKFKNTKGSGTERGKATAEGASEDWEGEAEY
jgi:hypothetical protein